MAKSNTKMPDPAEESVETKAKAKEPKLDAGPKKGPKGEYQPARYRTQRGSIRRDV